MGAEFPTNGVLVDQVPSPLLPAVASSRDVTNFDATWTTLPATDSPQGAGGNVLPEDPFLGYSYTRPSLHPAVLA
jgi:hypothetical protein